MNIYLNCINHINRQIKKNHNKNKNPDGSKCFKDNKINDK